MTFNERLGSQQDGLKRSPQVHVDILEMSSNFGVVTAYGRFFGPFHLQFLGRALRWIAFAAGFRFPGNASPGRWAWITSSNWVTASRL